MGAHPRRCGEHPDLTLEIRGRWGSSPQVRGTSGRKRTEQWAEGLIPAGAGNMELISMALARAGAHPRRCGEHRRMPCGHAPTMGSSPQVRGTSAGCRSRASGQGLVPAGAGNICYEIRHGAPSRAHPRRCGEHSLYLEGTAVTAGSSPQVRGTSTAATAGGQPGRAHPRRCGEHYPVGTVGRALKGSSPQVRGTSSKRAAGLSGAWAHPRRCGEHEVFLAGAFDQQGSSPQVRGTSPARASRERRPGLIPAGAGNIASVPPRAPTRAHPRRCGEHLFVQGDALAPPGSSPQVRGTSGVAVRPRAVVRLIPAGAGNINR